MSDAFIADDVREFILLHIDTVAQMEALLLLREDAGQNWTIREVARRLYVSDSAAGEVMGRLVSAGLCAHAAESYRYDPGEPERRALIDRVAEAYSSYLIAVTAIIHDKSARIQKFADAFRFRRDK
ncbi:MAG TPA: hypothetical protein VHV26_14575 [Rhizomicrobium sp.]|jgi:hypothetical protein|nr:hypothetical protein [Rhizomicrobium sp.]